MKYDVFVVLAGHSAARRWHGTYKTKSYAERVARELTGYGRIGIVVPRETR